MNTFGYKRQQGAVLVIALVMLLVLTLLATSSIRGTALDARITGNRAHTNQQFSLADAALREGEFRLYGPGHVRDKLEPNPNNCKLTNTLKKSGLNRPCLLPEMSREGLDEYFVSPLAALDGVTPSDGALNWMPYRGLDAVQVFNFASGEPNSFWNVYRLMDGSEDNAAFNPEYGDAMTGRGTFYFLVTAQADNEVAVQSTVTTVYLGLDE